MFFWFSNNLCETRIDSFEHGHMIVNHNELGYVR